MGNLSLLDRAGELDPYDNCRIRNKRVYTVHGMNIQIYTCHVISSNSVIKNGTQSVYIGISKPATEKTGISKHATEKTGFYVYVFYIICNFSVNKVPLLGVCSTFNLGSFECFKSTLFFTRVPLRAIYNEMRTHHHKVPHASSLSHKRGHRATAWPQ